VIETMNRNSFVTLMGAALGLAASGLVFGADAAGARIVAPRPDILIDGQTYAVGGRIDVVRTSLPVPVVPRPVHGAVYLKDLDRSLYEIQPNDALRRVERLALLAGDLALDVERWARVVKATDQVHVRGRYGHVFYPVHAAGTVMPRPLPRSGLRVDALTLNGRPVTLATPAQARRLARIASQRVLEFIRLRPVPMIGLPTRPTIEGTDVVDSNHVVVDVRFVPLPLPIQPAGARLMPGHRESFLYTVSTDHVESLGQPDGGPWPIEPMASANAAGTSGTPAATSVRPVSPVARARADALRRFAAVHRASGPGVACGWSPRVKSEATDRASGRIAIVCQTFGGILGNWFGPSIRYMYDADGNFLSQVSQVTP
jgi:hypothetical protein